MSQARNLLKAIPIISIVDDDAEARQGVEQFVLSLGYGASTFISADEFLKSEQVSTTSCLITDLHMPGLSGLDLQDRLIARGHRFPIIFITGHADNIARTCAMNAGAAGFLSKPINCDHLISHLNKALKARDPKSAVQPMIVKAAAD